MSNLHLDNLINNEYWKRFQLNGIYYDQLQCMIHLSSKGTLLSEKYRVWMELFNPKISHIAVGKNACISQTSFIASTRYTNKLNKICPFIFPKMSIFNDVCDLTDNNNHLIIDNNLLNNDDNKDKNLVYNNAQIKFSYLNNDSNIIRGFPMLKYHLLPKKKLGLELAPEIFIDKVFNISIYISI